MDAHAFINRIRSLFNIDRHQIPGLTNSQWEWFRDDPCGFLIRCDDNLAETICAVVESRQNKRRAA